MTKIPKDSKVIMVSGEANTTYSGSKALKKLAKWYSMEDLEDSIGGGGGGIYPGPNETVLTRIPNDYLGWLNKGGNYIYQAVEINSTTEQVTVTGLGEEIINFFPNQAAILVGDTITISGASVPGNNGDWVVTSASYSLNGATEITVKQTADRKLTAELVPDPSNVICTYKKRIIAELDWVQAQLEDGTLIWEAYDYSNWDNEDIDGYWVVMKPNQTTGEYDYITHLKMSENFWEYWYNYTVKVEGEPNSVAFTTATTWYSSSSTDNVGSANFKLSLVNNELVLTEEIFDLEKTWNELYIELTNVAQDSYALSFATPWYNPDNDYYGMMYGSDMGWVWLYTPLFSMYHVGYNLLTNETKLIDISESFFDIKNINSNDTGGVQKGIELLYAGAISHPKYGLLLHLKSDLTDGSPTALWSPNFENVEYATILDMYRTNPLEGKFMLNNGLLYFGGIRTGITNEYIICANPYTTSYPNFGIRFSRKKLDDISAESEYETITNYFEEAIYNPGNTLYYWERENSLIVSYYSPTLGPYNLRIDNFFVWRNNKKLPELFKTTNTYPNMIYDDMLISWDQSWTYDKITSLTNIFNENTF